MHDSSGGNVERGETDAHLTGLFAHAIGLDKPGITGVRVCAGNGAIAITSDSQVASVALLYRISDLFGETLAKLFIPEEIAGAMLQRQQATAIIAARQKIVDGAVGMVEMALERIEKESVVQLDEERKANMVSNLMVVLCSDKNASPVINTGSLY